MEIIFLLIPLALILLAAAVGAFFWAVRHGQFDDLDREASRILFDEDLQQTPPASRQSTSAVEKEQTPAP